MAKKTIFLWLFFVHNTTCFPFTKIIKSLLSKAAFTTATTVSQSPEEAQEELKSGNIKKWSENHKTVLAGAAATFSTIITHYYMKSAHSARTLSKIPPISHPRFKGVPHFLLSTTIATAALYTGLRAGNKLKEEFNEHNSPEK